MTAAPFSRRTLLAGGSVAALAATGIGRAVLGGPRSGALARLATAAGPKISVGFVASVDPVLDGARVVPAASLRAGGLGSAAVARIAGATPRSLDGPVDALRLDALYGIPQVDEPLRHFAWTYRRAPLSVSPPTRLAVPVGPTSIGFELAVDGRAAATTVLTAGEDDGLPRLRPGTYLLGLAPDVWGSATTLPRADDPAWADLASVALTIRAA